MKKLFLLLFLLPSIVIAQDLSPLTVEKIMRDPLWIGSSPSGVFWSPNSEKIYFNWNPEGEENSSLYSVSLSETQPKKLEKGEENLARALRRGIVNHDKSKLVFTMDNVLYLWDIQAKQAKTLIAARQHFSDLSFGFEGKAVVFREGNNLFAYFLDTGFLMQLTDFRKGQDSWEAKKDGQESFFEENALENSEVLARRKERREKRNKLREEKDSLPKTIYLGQKQLRRISLSPDGNTVFYQLANQPKIERPKVPDYVTESGYTEDLNARPMVGTEQPEYTHFIYNRERDTVIKIDTENIPGIRDIPEFYKDYPEVYKKLKKDPPLRPVVISNPIWEGEKSFVVIRSEDNKDRWIMQLNRESGELTLLDRQRDEAWIAGPGIGYAYSPGNVGWLDKNTIWFQSEESGYSHLYSLNIRNKKKKALTQGKYEVQSAELSPDKKYFYITTNEVSPGQTQFYHLNIQTGEKIRITKKRGGNKTVVSPDGKYLTSLHSTPTNPWELFLQENQPNSISQQITFKAASEEFKSYSWRTPEIFTFKNRDKQEVYAEVLKPEVPAASRPGVVFVHGAGYLQDVKESWSDSYFREHMFMNMLADHGYTVLNIDYRASAGYGRGWRTAIYRYMGQNDLADIVDGAKYMIENFDVNPENVGLWGGSYGGFMTLMALFTTDVFNCGAALRSVTDWSHYNHGYTSNILNLPQNDPIAYKRSSPIYFADGLHGNLLMAHGMIDTNVHLQDIVRLTQRLIELGKDNWELAVYPLENHGFTEPESWTDEYKRIFKLFEENLR